MPGITRAAALPNKATEVLQTSARGLLRLLVTVVDAGVDLVPTFYRRDKQKIVHAWGDVKVTGETVQDGDYLTRLPVVPGSLRLAASGVPSLVDRDGDGTLRIDRIVGSILSAGVDGATGALATQQFNSAGADFVAAGVVAGDQLVISDGVEKGEYVIATVAATQLVTTLPFKVGGQSLLSYSIYAVEKDCGSVSYFTGKLKLVYPESPASASPAARGTVLGTSSFPVNLDPAMTLGADIDAGGPVAATFNAAGAVANGVAAGFAAAVGEDLVLAVNGGENQLATFASGEDTIDEYKDSINAQVVGLNAAAVCDAAALAQFLTHLKAKYNAHAIFVTVHDNADTNLVTAPDATDLATAETLANAIKTQINLHYVALSEVEEAITLLNEVKADYNAHRILTAAGVHDNADATNSVVAADATDLTSAETLANDVKTKLNLHYLMLSELEEACTLLNELKADYNAHRILTAAGVHDNADSVNSIVSADATDLATADTLANEIKAKLNLHYVALSELEEAILLVNELRSVYNAHRVLTGASVHGHADSTNSVGSPAATDLASAETLANEIKAKLNLHYLMLSKLEEAITLVNGLATEYEAHRVLLTSHGVADAVNLITAPVATDLATADALANDIKAQYNAHRVTVAGVHDNADSVNSVGSADATNLASLQTLANEIKTKYNLHLVSFSELDEAITMVNAVKSDYNAHRVALASHGAADGTNIVAVADATDLTTAEALANDIKAKYNAHRVLTAAGVHDNADGVNSVGSADAVSMATLKTLANELKTKINLHYLAPSEVDEAVALANDIKAEYNAHRVLRAGHTTGAWGGCAFTLPGGTDVTLTDATSPFVADDVGKPIVVSGSFSPANDGTFTITAVAGGGGSCTYTNAAGVAEAFIAATLGTVPDVHGAADGTNIVAVADATDLTTAEALANDIKAKYNAHIILVGGVHGAADLANGVGAADATNLATLKTLLNATRTAYASHRVLIAGAVHGSPDAIDVVISDPVGTAAIHLTADVTNTITEDAVGTAAIHLLDDTTNTDATPAVGTADVHLIDDATHTIGAADATNLATLKTLVNEIKTDYNLHLADTSVHGAADAINVCAVDAVGTAAVHLTDDVTHTIAAADATNLATLKTLSTELKTDYNLHIADVTSHGAADATNPCTADSMGTAAVHLIDDITHTVTSPDATTEATLRTLVNEIKSDYNAHLADTSVHGAADATNVVTSNPVGAAAVHLIDDTASITSPDATNLATLKTLTAELRTDYATHLANTTVHKAADTTYVATAMEWRLTLTSDLKGTSSRIAVVSGTGTILTKLGLTVGTSSGSGNVANIDAVVFAEYKSIVEGAIANCSATLDETGKPRLSSSSVNTGLASKIQISGTARTRFGFDAGLHTGADPGAQIPVVASYYKTTLVAGRVVLSITNQGDMSMRLAGNNSRATVEIETLSQT